MVTEGGVPLFQKHLLNVPLKEPTKVRALRAPAGTAECQAAKPVKVPGQGEPPRERLVSGSDRSVEPWNQSLSRTTRFVFGRVEALAKRSHSIEDSLQLPMCIILYHFVSSCIHSFSPRAQVKTRRREVAPSPAPFERCRAPTCGVGAWRRCRRGCYSKAPMWQSPRPGG